MNRRDLLRGLFALPLLRALKRDEPDSTESVVVLGTSSDWYIHELPVPELPQFSTNVYMWDGKSWWHRPPG